MQTKNITYFNNHWTNHLALLHDRSLFPVPHTEVIIVIRCIHTGQLFAIILQMKIFEGLGITLLMIMKNMLFDGPKS